MATPAYAPPVVGPGGLTVSGYLSILADNLQGYLNIFGQNQYIGSDSAIYQLLAILSLKQSDTNLGLQLTYNQSSPQTAVGAGLDRQLKMNGLVRKPFSYSTALLTLTGTATLTNAFAQDQNGNLWAIPSPTTIVGGSINVTAVCTTPGNVIAEPGQITIKATPTLGWTAVTNAAVSIPGLPVESDSEARAVQAISVAAPSITRLQSTIAAVLAVTGVSRIALPQPTPGSEGSSIENPTGGVDVWGNPAHSISMVVEGGADLAVATAIYLKRGIGPFMNGTTSQPVTDPINGVTTVVRFSRPTYVPLLVYFALHAYQGSITTAQLSAVQAALVAYLAELAIGEVASASALVYEAMSINTNLAAPSFGVANMLLGAQQATTTATTTATSNSIVVASATGIIVGQYVFGTGILPGTTVTVISGTTLTISNPATVSNTGVVVVFGTLSAADVAMPNYNYVVQTTDSSVQGGAV